MNDHDRIDQVEPQPPSPVAGSASTRRRLLVGGGAGAVLASLKSGSALAEGVCVSPSAFTSITLNPATSHKPGERLICHSHGYWKNRSAWPVPRTTKVGSYFCLGSGTAAIGINGDTTLIDVLEKQNGVIPGGDAHYARDLISALLDVSAGHAGTYLTVMQIQKMWALVFCGGTYSVNGTLWTRETVRAFLDVLVSGS